MPDLNRQKTDWLSTFTELKVVLIEGRNRCSRGLSKKVVTIDAEVSRINQLGSAGSFYYKKKHGFNKTSLL